jgi:putative ABC transport system permease protein
MAMNVGPILRAMKHNRTRFVLIVLEIAITLAIVTNCVNVILAERAKMQQHSGFDDANIIQMHVRPFSPDFQQEGAIDTAIDADLRTMAGVPGVRAVANTNFRLWEGGGSSTGVVVVGTKAEPVSTQIYWGTRDLADTLGSKIIAGRGFREGDHGTGTQPDPQQVTIISKSLADLLFPDGRAVGRQIQEAVRAGELLEEPRTVIGVVEEFWNPFGRPSNLDPISNRVMFLPARVGGFNSGMRYLIRTEPGAIQSVVGEVERRLTAANNGRVFSFVPVTERRSSHFASSSIVVTTMTCIIVALVAVTALGLLGLTSLSVTERRRQIGTRRALGATRADILRHFLVENWLTTTAGLVLGVGAAYGLNFLLVTHVTDVKLPWQLVACGVVLLWINGLAATLPPALRASRVPPSIATRSV